MKIGFTGTQVGMTQQQTDEVHRLLRKFRAAEFHHGDCVGADQQAHGEAMVLGVRTVIHPPVIGAKRAYCPADETRPPKEYLLRNHDIVDETQVLIATPKEITEQLRSGTWATIRYAKKMNRRVYIVYPDGSSVQTGSLWPK